MRITFLGNVLYEGDDAKDKFEEISTSLISICRALEEEIPKTYFIRKDESPEDYYDNLQNLNPIVYENFEKLRAYMDNFVTYVFIKPSSTGIGLYVLNDGKLEYQSIGGILTFLTIVPSKSPLKLEE